MVGDETELGRKTVAGEKCLGYPVRRVFFLACRLAFTR